VLESITLASQTATCFDIKPACIMDGPSLAIGVQGGPLDKLEHHIPVSRRCVSLVKIIARICLTEGRMI
jgi:hypothetical protein